LSAVQVVAWHERYSTNAVKYLCYSLNSAINQLDRFLDNFPHKVIDDVSLHQQLNLSVLGQVTALNTLLLSKVWPVLRAVPTTKKSLSSLKTISVSSI
ncbi:hypothetical protein BDB00DRAFT_734851, partial [Zychaea mexicana]|uniref:uncharacterized protein n=1 Tax=Zychaea mexicana TaxID=64656 RepID=UPI0022FF1C5C